MVVDANVVDRTECQVEVGSDHIVVGTRCAMSILCNVMSAPMHENSFKQIEVLSSGDSVSATCGMPTILILY